jgi:peptide/nickel transport system ATP-binding protein
MNTLRGPRLLMRPNWPRHPTEPRASTGPASPVGREPRVRVSDLRVTFTQEGRPVEAVRGVSLDIGDGEIIGVVGESGSGKTVFGLSLLGLLPKDLPPRVEGRAIVCGVDMVTATPEARRIVRRRYLGAVFQDPMTSLNPTMRIGRQVVEAAGSPEAAVRLLQLVGFPEPQGRFRAYPHELSGGQRQRVMLAMAVAGTPKLVVADEPTTALDVTVQAQILGLLRQLREEIGCSFILITHDLGVAAQVADRIAVFYGGRLMELGTSAEVLASPAHPYTAGLLRSRLTMAVQRNKYLVTLSGEPPDPSRNPPGCPFAPRCPHRVDACNERPPDLMPLPVGGRSVACIRALDLPPFNASSDQITASVPQQQTDSHIVVRVSEVSKSFVVRHNLWRRDRLLALRKVDLEIRAGESVAIVGESGCGKSTLLRIVAGLLRQDSGTVEYGAQGRSQMVFQDAGASLTPWLRVGELIGERLRHEAGLSRRDRATRVGEILRFVGLPAELAQAKANSLSGGQRQRVAIARTIIVPPPLLLCDEPTSSLDASLAASVLNLLTRLRVEFGFALLFVTHDLAIARLVADRIAVMYLGQIVEEGPVEEVTTLPAHPYTAALVMAVPDAGKRPVGIRGEPASALSPPSGCPFHPRCPIAIEKCNITMPPLEEHRQDRHVACWRAFAQLEADSGVADGRFDQAVVQRGVNP